MPRIFYRILGILLRLVGLLLWERYQHFYFLGHYLSGNGRTLRLSPERLTGYRYSDELICLRGSLSNRSKYVVIGGRRGKTVHQSVGKVRARLVGNTVILLDYYLFYPTCSKKLRHGHACGCPAYTRTWGEWSEDIAIRLPFRVPERLIRRCGDDIWAEAETFREGGRYRLCLKLGGSDRFWADKGTPFWTVCRMPYSA